jgi:hypothetical protein
MAKLFNQIDMAEQELASVIAAASDFFDSEKEKQATLAWIQQDPEAVLASSEKPFMKKIAKAMMKLSALQVKEYTPQSFAKALADQKTFLETQMDEKIAAERNRMEELITQQHDYFEGRLATEITRMERVFDDHKRMMKAAVSLLSDEIELKGDHVVNVSKLLKRFMPAIAVLSNLTDVDWTHEIDKCVPR